MGNEDDKNEECKFTLGGEFDKRKQSSYKLAADNRARDDRMCYTQDKSRVDLAKNNSGKPTVKSGFQLEMPLKYNHLLVRAMGGVGPAPNYFVAKQATMEIAKGAKLKDYDVEIGKVKLKYDPNSGVYFNASLEPIKFEGMTCNIPLINLGVAASRGMPIGNLVMAELKRFLISSGYDPQTTILEEITVKGPSAEIGFGVGASLECAAGAKITGIKLRFRQKISDTESAYFDCTFSAGLKAGAKINGFTTGNGKQGVKQEKNIAFGFWEVSAGMAVATDAKLTSQSAGITQGSVSRTEKIFSINQSIQQPQGDFMDTEKLRAEVRSLAAGHELRLRQIYETVKGTQAKTNAIMAYIGDLHQDMLHRRVEDKRQAIHARTLANFQGVQSGFGLIAQIGAETGSRGLQRFGAAGLALTQGVLGFAQLTGSFGLTAVSGLAMLTPATAIIGGLFALVSLFSCGGDKQAKALQKALKGISTQISDLHKDMHLGFEAVIKNQQSLFKFMMEGFQVINFQLFDEQVHLSRIDEKLDLILAQLQQIGIKADQEERRKMYEMLERFDVSNDFKAVTKALQSIRHQLKLAAYSLKGLPDQGNNFSGWYHLNSLTNLFKEPEFQQFNFDSKNICNLAWAELPLECAITINLYTLNDFYDTDDTIKSIKAKINNEILRFAKPTAKFIRDISSKEFLSRFFKYYQHKISLIKASADSSLNYIVSHFTQPAMQVYARDVLAKNEEHIGENIEGIKLSIKRDSERDLKIVSGTHLELLQAKTIEYNACLKDFKSQLGILLTMLEINDHDIGFLYKKINNLSLIAENHYRSEGIAEIEEDVELPHKLSYHYLRINTDNQFKGVDFTEDEINKIQTSAAENAEPMSDYLESVGMMMDACATLSQSVLINPEAEVGLNSPTTSDELKQNYDEGEMLMQASQETEEVMKLLRPVFEAAKKAQGHCVVPVVGISGDGKSTLLNYLNGTNYGMEFDDSGFPAPLWTADLKPEICKRGEQLGVSQTKIPQMVCIENIEHTYCDTAGLGDSAGDAADIAAAFSPYLINKNAQSTKGIVWTLNIQQFTTSRAEKIKDFLSYLLSISKGNPDVIANAITVVVTRGTEHTDRAGVLRNFKKIIANNTITSQKEKELLERIFNAIEDDKQSIVIANVFDKTGKNADEIHKAISRFKPMPTSLFDFSCYSKNQKVLNAHFHKAAKLYVEFCQYIETEEGRDTACTSKLDQLIGNAATLSTAKAANESLLEKVNKELAALRKQAKALSDTKSLLEDDAQMTILKSYEFKHKALHGQEKVAVQKFKAGALAGNQIFENEKPHLLNKGWADLRLHRIKHHRREILGKPPVRGLGHINIHYPTDFPVQVTYHAKVGVTMEPGTEKNTNGYETKLVYKLGKDVDVKFDIKALKKHTPEGKAQLRDMHVECNSNARAIVSLEKRSRDLKQEIATQNTLLDQCNKKASELNKEKALYQDRLTKARNILNDNASCFQAVFECSEILGLHKSNSIMQQFLELFKMPRPEIQPQHQPKPVEKVIKKKVTFMDEVPEQFGDHHYYADDEIHALMINYLGTDPRNMIIEATTVGQHDTIQGLAGVLAHRREAILAASKLNMRVFIPINIGNFHWVLAILDYANGLANQRIFYADPMGGNSPIVDQMIKVGLGLPATTKIDYSSEIYQQDGFNCGPWVIELAAGFAVNGAFPASGTIDINAKRQEHQLICKAAATDNYQTKFNPKFFNQTKSASCEDHPGRYCTTKF